MNIKEIKRYYKEDIGNYWSIDQIPTDNDGEFVTFEDHKAVVEEMQKIIEELEFIMNKYENCNNCVNDCDRRNGRCHNWTNK